MEGSMRVDPATRPDDSVTSIWSTDANQNVILTSDVVRDVAFPFAAVLPTDEYIYKPCGATGSKAEVASGAHRDVFLRRS